MYSSMMTSYSDVQAYVFATFYKPSVFVELANYGFVNLFRLAKDHFNGSLDELYSIIFTCIVLSDRQFAKVTSKSHFNDSDGVTSVVFYFYSLCAIVCKANYDRKVVHQNRGEVRSITKLVWLPTHSYD